MQADPSRDANSKWSMWDFPLVYSSSIRVVNLKYFSLTKSKVLSKRPPNKSWSFRLFRLLRSSIHSRLLEEDLDLIWTTFPSHHRSDCHTCCTVSWRSNWWGKQAAGFEVWTSAWSGDRLARTQLSSRPIISIHVLRQSAQRLFGCHKLAIAAGIPVASQKRGTLPFPRAENDEDPVAFTVLRAFYSSFLWCELPWPPPVWKTDFWPGTR